MASLTPQARKHRPAPPAMSTNNKWTKKEESTLKKLYKNHTGSAIALMMNRTRSSVQSKATALGLSGTKTQKHMKSLGHKV